MFLASLLYLIMLAALCPALIKMLSRAGAQSRALSFALAGVCLIVASLTIVCIVGNPEMCQWKATLSRPEQAVRQTIDIAPLAVHQRSGPTYLLLDLAQGQCPVPLNISLNGSEFKCTAIPWWQLRPNAQFLAVLQLQQKAMGVTLSSYRQWWAVPLPPSLIRYGATNTITIACGSEAPLTIYGDYCLADKTSARLPSLLLASWTKAFCTYDHYDARVYETKEMARVHSSYRAGRDNIHEAWADLICPLMPVNDRVNIASDWYRSSTTIAGGVSPPRRKACGRLLLLYQCLPCIWLKVSIPPPCNWQSVKSICRQ